MIREKLNKYVDLLRYKQKLLQDDFKEHITIQRRSIYDLRGVWISVECACGHRFPTPFHIRGNGTCPECNKLFCRAMKTDEYVKKPELKSQKSTTTSRVGFYVGKKLRKFREKKSGHNYRKKKLAKPRGEFSIT